MALLGHHHTCPSDSRYSEKLPKQGIAKSDGTGMSAVAMC